jgi:uncharacterized protein (DUF2235 family)
VYSLVRFVALLQPVHILIPFTVRDFDKTILAAYRWLSDNYEDGDCIYLFGKTRRLR